MRITNTMMTNNILLNINRNRETLSMYETQMATGKKIQKPSDDPIVAVRALKFRTNVKEIEQYKDNAEDAISWTSVTEQAVSNVTDIMKRIRELSVQATSDVMNIENRKNVVTEIDQLMEQFMTEANATYAGRHVFGGYKTNMPLVFNESKADTYELNQSFSANDVEETQRVVNDVIIDTHRIRLGYADITGLTAATETTITGIAAFNNVNTLNSTDPNAFTPAVGDINVLADTGELIFNEADLSSIPDPLDLVFEKTGFQKGDLVPDHYYTGTNTTTGDTFVVDNEEMLYQVSYSQELAVNTMGYEMVGIDMARDIQELVATTKDIAADSSLTSALEEDLLGDMFNELIGKMDTHINQLLNTRAEIGVKINRLELTINRLDEDRLNFTDLLSKNEDIDLAEVMIKMSSQETVYNASLQASSKIIQPTLLDFIR